MSQESTTPDLVALVQRMVAATNARVFDAVMSFYASDAVLDDLGLGEVFEGQEAIRGLYEDWWRAYEDHEQEAEENRDLGNGVSLVVFLQRARLRDTTAALHNRYVAVSIIANGLIKKQTLYQYVDQAHAAAERLAEERG